MDDNPYTQGLSNSAFERLQLHMQLQSLQNPSFFDNPALWPRLHPLGERALLQLQHGLNNDSSTTTQMPQLVPHTQTVVPSQKVVFHEFSSSATSVNIEGGDNSITTNNRKQQDEMENSMINEVFSSLESSTVASIAFNNRSEAAAMGTIMSSSQLNGMRMEQSSMNNIQSLSGLQTELNELIHGQNGGGFATNEDQMTTEFDCFKEMGDTSKDSMISWWANDFDTKSSSSNSWNATSVLHSEGMFQDYVLGYDL
ncbi:transcription factor MYB36-like [Macadamia integrifolia]|uniref:transcription factor MYB36-like n=1 Tax=Macadamia integrifolia TaxID=60698 RepID=UPI001C4F38AC|nr:transcription factor MYB36-like [Macadamia integrifolia]